MDLSRRRFLSMLGLAPLIPLVAPTKAYSFLGNILRRPAPISRFAMTYFRVTVAGQTEPLFVSQPFNVLMIDNSISVEEVVSRLKLSIPKDKIVDYRMTFQETRIDPNEPVLVRDWRESGAIGPHNIVTENPVPEAFGIRQEWKPDQFKIVQNEHGYNVGWKRVDAHAVGEPIYMMGSLEG